MRNTTVPALLWLLALSLMSCGQQRTPASDTSEPGTPATNVTVWPASLVVMGDGYPEAGNPCRRIGESMVTADFLDDSAVLVGCPTSEPEAMAAVGGRTVGAVDGITLISIPQGDANVGMTAAPPVSPEGTPAQ